MIDPKTGEELPKGGLPQTVMGEPLEDISFTNFDTDTLPPSELDVIDPIFSPDDEYIKVASLGLLSRGAAKLLSPRNDIFAKAEKRKEEIIQERQQQLEEIEKPETTQQAEVAQAEMGEINPEIGRIDPIPDPATSDNVANVEVPPDYQQRLNENYNRMTNEEFIAEMNRTGVIDEDGLLSDFRAVGAAGDAKIPDEERTLSTIEAISKAYSGQIDEAKRGEITLEETRKTADLLGVTPNRLSKLILGRQRGGVIVDAANGMGLAETMVAARTLLVQEIKVLDSLGSKAEFGGESEALAFRQQMEYVAQLQAQIKGSQTEIARALGSFRIPVREGEGATEAIRMRDTAAILEEYGGTDDIRDMARAYNQASSIEERAGIARAAGKFKRFTDAFYEAWINMLLSNPVTHTKNIAGAMLVIGAHGFETAGAVAVGKLRNQFTGGEDVTYAGQLNAQMFGMMMSMREAFGMAGRAFMTGENPMPGTKIDGAAGRRPPGSFSAEGLQAQGVLGTTADVLGNIMTLGRVPTRALEFEDSFFKVVAHRQALYEEAYRSGMTKGYRGDRLADHIANFLVDPPATAIEKAEGHARYVTLQTKLDETGRNLSKVRRIPGLRYFVPFFNTPYNSFKYAFVDRTPIGLFFGESKKIIERGRSPGATRADVAAANLAYSRITMGSGIAAMVAMYAAEGLITGGGPADPEIRNAMLRRGWQPYSIKVGDQYYSYAGGEPITSTIGLAADAADVLMRGDVDPTKAEEVTAALTAAMSNQLTNKTFMQGFATLVSVLDDPQRYAGTAQDRLVASLVPRIVSQGERLVDPIQRETRSRIDVLRAQIPGLSETLPPRRNLWGQPIAIGGALGPDIVSPIYMSEDGPGETKNEIAETMGIKNYNQRAYKLDQEFLDLRWGPGKHPDALSGELGFTAEEQSRYHQYAGIRTMQNMERLVKNKQYQDLKRGAMSDVSGSSLARDRAIDMLRRAVTEAREQARADILQDPEFGRDLRVRIQQLNRVRRQQGIMLREATQ
jgi:hypothetical protein